ncbi:TPA: conjugal transfer protein [Streptococcus agalactiae]|nr:conjugal transfer protein [Streptococcus agalactiae]HEM9599381.1 conjugal transfer protein [Streptococcus agalactiae]HEM9636276.1 conjugal transfer protein [Streptococcus agalactiae]
MFFTETVYADPPFSTIGDGVSKSINDWFKNLFMEIMRTAIGFCKGIFGQITQTNNKDIQKWYFLFLGFATSLVVVVVLARIVLTILKEADESTDVTWVNIIMDSIKSAISIPVMVFLQYILINKIVVPLGQYMFDMNTKYSADSIAKTKNIGNVVQLGPFVQILLVCFFAVVTVVFVIKLCIYLCDTIWFNLTIPFVAVSIATESFDYGATWWKKLLYVNISLLSQVLSMTLCVWGVTHWKTGGFYAFAISVGMGYLVLHSPKVIEDFWSSVGITKSGGRGLRSLVMMLKRS